MHLSRYASSDRARCGIIRCTVGAAVAASLIIASGQGVAGHSIGHFPSYYPDEIRIDILDPAEAAERLGKETLHAYVGAKPNFTASVPEHVQTISSLGSFVVLSINAASEHFKTEQARCSAARGILAALRAEKTPGFVFHPYAVTPYHSDYLHHLDRIEALTATAGNGAMPPASLRIGAKGRITEAIVRARWSLAAAGADLMLEEVSTDDLAAAGMRSDGWARAPWAKEGWFQAYQVLEPGLGAEARAAAEDIYGHLVRREFVGLTERVNLERRLLAALSKGCERVVVGYAPREEYVAAVYPAGIENIAYDSLGGLNSPVFVRTVKLTEYPWNGKLALAVRERPAAAWNPVAGFTDAPGRLMWSAIGDPAMIHFPFSASWMPNRVQAAVTKIEGQTGGITVPADAVRPQPGTGAFQPVGPRTFSSAKVVNEVLASPFEDGTEMDVPDLLYPFAFTYRWGSKADATQNAHEPGLAATFAAMQERLAGLKVVRVETSKHTIAEDITVARKTPVVEVYLRNAPGDDPQVAALAPPWSTVPWHLLALMEEAVVRDYAAFSEQESRRRNVPWLDLARDQALQAKLLALVTQFERDGYRPDALLHLVSADQARARWQSLRKFAETNGHFLIANGPYRLKAWTPDSVVLQAVREMTYPLGFGTFDRFANPPRAMIETAAREAGEIVVTASAEMTVKMGRAYKVMTEPLSRNTARGTFGLLVVSRYLLIGPEGTVLNVDKMHWRDDGRFDIQIPERLAPGEYTVLVAVFLDGNATLPSARMLRFRVGGPG